MCMALQFLVDPKVIASVDQKKERGTGATFGATVRNKQG